VVDGALPCAAAAPTKEQIEMRLVVSEWITLDGVIQAPMYPGEDTDGGFKHGGWQTAFVCGAPVVTDGPFPETKEFLAGYWLVDVDRPERAYEIAAKTSAAPGPGGVPLNMPIEVREVMKATLAEV
jgi:hypothetical protein